MPFKIIREKKRAESVERVQAIVTGTMPSPGDDWSQCPERFVDPATEGPYYKNGSPERTNLVEEGTVGEPVALSGYVFKSNAIRVCKKFWHWLTNYRLSLKQIRLKSLSRKIFKFSSLNQSSFIEVEDL